MGTFFAAAVRLTNDTVACCPALFYFRSVVVRFCLNVVVKLYLKQRQVIIILRVVVYQLSHIVN